MAPPIVTENVTVSKEGLSTLYKPAQGKPSVEYVVEAMDSFASTDNA